MQEPMQSIKYGVTDRVYQDNYGDRMVHIIGHKIPGNYIVERPNDILGDPFFNNVTLLLHLDENFTDSSQLITTLSPQNFGVGSLPTIRNDIFRSGSGSVFITQNSRTNYVTPSTSNYFLGGDFTFEFWIYPTASTSAFTGRLFGYTLAPNDLSNRWTLIQLDNGTFRLFGLSGTILTSTLSAPLNTWTHVALCKRNNLYSFFINGTLGGSVTNTNALCNPGGYIHLFGTGFNTDATTFGGYIDEVRITNGVCRYTSNFIPSSRFPDVRERLSY